MTIHGFAPEQLPILGTMLPQANSRVEGVLPKSAQAAEARFVANRSGLKAMQMLDFLMSCRHPGSLRVETTRAPLFGQHALNRHRLIRGSGQDSLELRNLDLARVFGALVAGQRAEKDVEVAITQHLWR
jgi:hypothetical protein